MDTYLHSSLTTDLRYAMRQLRQFGEVSRALDALERMEAALEDADWHPDEEVTVVAVPSVK